jgi:hypothetical protein
MTYYSLQKLLISKPIFGDFEILIVQIKTGEVYVRFN